MEITPYKHQRQVIDRNPDREGLWWGTQVGKSLAAVWLSNSKDKPALIVTLKGLKKQWHELATDNSTVPFAVLTKEEFRRDWKALPRYNTVIADEAHVFANVTGSATAKAMHSYLKKHDPTHRYLLTATPYTSTPMSVFWLANHLGIKWPMDKFREAFFNIRLQHYRRCPNGKCAGCRQCCRQILEPKNDEATKARLRRCIESIGSTVRLSDCYDMPPEIHRDVELAPSSEQVRAMKLNAHLPNISRHRIECGHITGNGYEPDTFLDSPIDDYVIGKCAEFRKLAVVCRFRTQIERLRGIITDRKVYVLWGDMPDFHSVRVEAEGCGDCVVLIQADCAAGYALHSFEAMVFASCSYSHVSFAQVLGRLRHVGRKTPCLYLYPTCGKIGKAVLNCVRNHQDYMP